MCAQPRSLSFILCALLTLSTRETPPILLPTRQIQYILHRHGLPADVIIDKTPGVSGASSLSADAADEAQYASRALEIHAWLAAHPDVHTNHVVVLDDRPSAADAALAERFVQTDAGQGLTDADVERCRALLH